MPSQGRRDSGRGGSIEGGDTLNRWHGPLATKPHVVGYQAGGEIIEVGAEVDNLKVGQKVTTVFSFGSHAALRAVPARNAWPVPAGFDIKLASAIPVPFGTADDCLFEFGHLEGGRIRAGAGRREWRRRRRDSIGQARRRDGAGDRSSDERLERLKPLGLDHGINYRTANVAKSVMKLTNNKGVDLVVDPVGGETLQSSIISLAYRGRISMVGAAGRETMTVEVSSLMAELFFDRRFPRRRDHDRSRA